MEIFVTGGTGNIGQYVTLALLERGHHVRLLTRNPDKIPAWKGMENVTVIGGHMQDEPLMAKCVQGCDAVIHIALGWGNEPLSMLENDTRVTAHLLQAAAAAGVQKFIYTSSTAAAGPMHNGMDENDPCRPNDLYGATKAASEMFLLGFRQPYSPRGGYGEPVQMRRNVIRPGYTYSNPAVPGGASQSDRRFRNIAQAIVEGRDLCLSRNDGTQFLSARQIAQAYVRLVESDLNEEIFYALGKSFVSWYEIACMAKAMAPDSASCVTAPDEPREPALYCVDKMERKLGLAFDSREDLAAHIAWNLERARQQQGGAS